MTPSETYEQQMKDSDMIYTQVMSANYDTFDEVNRLVVMLYVPDMTVSRAGISHALKRLEKEFNDDPK